MTFAPRVVATLAQSGLDGDANPLVISVTPLDNELIAVKAQTWDKGTTIGLPSGGSLTYTRQVTGNTGSFNTYGTIFTAPVGTSPGTFNITVPAPSASSFHTAQVEIWPAGSTVAGTPAIATAIGSGAPSATITTVGTGSAVTWLCGDENSVAPGTPTYLSSATGEGIGDGHLHSSSVQYYAWQFAGTAGSQTFGISSPGGMAYSLAALEILPPSGAAAPAPALRPVSQYASFF